MGVSSERQEGAMSPLPAKKESENSLYLQILSSKILPSPWKKSTDAHGYYRPGMAKLRPSKVFFAAPVTNFKEVLPCFCKKTL